jgi:glycosyltransferase involved in cell wall biosynthesis
MTNPGVTISALIPAFNEAERIAETVAATRRLPGITEVIVVDDGSTDGTGDRADAAGADVVLCVPHGGKGAALQAGYVVAQGAILLLMDADLGASAKEAEVLLAPVVACEADMTIATFPVLPHRGGVGLVVRLARWGIYRLTGRVMQAPLSGQRALRRDMVEATGGFAAGWGVEIALTVAALRAGYRVANGNRAHRDGPTANRLTSPIRSRRSYLAVARD